MQLVGGKLKKYKLRHKIEMKQMEAHKGIFKH